MQSTEIIPISGRLTKYALHCKDVRSLSKNIPVLINCSHLHFKSIGGGD